MLKHPDLPDNPLVPENKVITDVRGSREWWRFQHRYDMDQPDLLDIYARWHAVTAPRGAMLLGEVNITDPGRLGRHTAGRGLDAVFWFGLIEHRWEPDRFTEWTRQALDGAAGLVWVLSSHDRPRAPSRYGGGTAGRRRALTLATLTAGFPCFPLLYQGDELGLQDAEVPADRVQDPLVPTAGRRIPVTRLVRQCRGQLRPAWGSPTAPNRGSRSATASPNRQSARSARTRHPR